MATDIPIIRKNPIERGVSQISTMADVAYKRLEEESNNFFAQLLRVLQYIPAKYCQEVKPHGVL